MAQSTTTPPSGQQRHHKYGQCYTHLAAADVDANEKVSQTEFVACVADWTAGALRDWDALGSFLQSVYTTLDDGSGGISIAGLSTTTAVTTLPAVDEICEAIVKGMLQAFDAVEIPPTRCSIFLSMGDADKDNQLTPSEFPTFVKAVAQHYQPGGDSSLIDPSNELPALLQRVFEDFQTDANVIDVSGSRLGTPPANPTRGPIYTSLCRQTLVAVAALHRVVQTTTLAPVAAPPPSSNVRFCVTALRASDGDRNGQLNTTEYVRFVNVVSGNQYISRNYDTLPTVLQQNFVAYTNGNEWIATDIGTPSTTT